MEALSKIANPLQSSDSLSLTTRSGPLLPAGMGLALSVLMAEAQAAYPNQTLPPGTPDMYLTQWEPLALKYGLETFRDGLLKAISESEFFPSPVSIGQHVAGIMRDRRYRENAKRYIEEADRYRAQVDQERAAEEKMGPRVLTEQDKRLDAILQAHKPKAAAPETSVADLVAEFRNKRTKVEAQ